MKKVILIIIMAICTSTIMAQQYHPLPTHDAIWNEHLWETFGPSNSQFTDYFISIKGDTIIQGNTYHKLYSTGQVNGFNSGGPFSSYFSDVYKGAFRNDSINKKVYLYATPSDHVLYDFNLQIGDTLPKFGGNDTTAMIGTYLGSSFIFVVDDIDSVLVSGLYHKRFKLVFGNTPSQSTTYLIEGIGASTGLLRYFAGSYSWGYQSELLCFIKDSINAYPYGAPCSLVGTNDISLENKIRIYPNPSNGLLNISNITNTITGIHVLNFMGELVYELKPKTIDESIDLSTLSKGVYYIIFNSMDNPPFAKKVILQ